MFCPLKTDTEYAFNADPASCYYSGDSSFTSNSSAPAHFQKRGMPFFSGVITVSITISRYYTPEIGRWLSRDPIQEKGGWNLYNYLSGNPVNMWDRLGQASCSEAGGTIKGNNCCCGSEIMSPNSQCCCAKDTLISKGGLKFEGFCTYIQVSGLLGGMQMICPLRSTITDSCTYYTLGLHISLAGLSFGLPMGLGAYSVSFTGAETPSDLEGYTRFSSATASVGLGGGISIILIGDARSEISDVPWSSGIDVGLDAMIGYAWISNVQEIPCK